MAKCECTKMKEGGMAEDKMDMAQDKAMIKKAIAMHDKQEHGGKKTNLTKLAKGGSASSRADGIAQRGKTRGTNVKMV